MKKVVIAMLLALMTNTLVKAQSEVLFRMKVLPDHEYSANMKMNIDMSMEGLPPAADGSPGKMQMESGTKMEMKTGAVNGKKEFPISMTMEMLPSTMTMNGKTNPVPTGATAAIPTMYGKCSVDGLPRIDSIPGTVLNDSLKRAMNKMVEGLQNNISFPEKPMKIGDTFVQDVPFNLPMMGAAMKTSVKVVYKLISISGGKANFDVTYTMDINMDEVKGMPAAMHMSGGGAGTMEYDIAASYPTHYIQNMDMNMNIGADGKNMTMKMKMKMDQQTVVH